MQNALAKTPPHHSETALRQTIPGRLLHRILGGNAEGAARADALLSLLVLPPALLHDGDRVSRACFAQVLNMLLFDDLVRRVPAATAYVADRVARAETVLHDHGAVRTVALDGMGALPNGREALLRILRPLGYELRGTYPLDRLKMTGRAYAQADLPEQIAQFFLSELHPERFSPAFQQAVAEVTSTSLDPLTPAAAALLQRFEAGEEPQVDEAAAVLPDLVACFDRQHAEPSLAAYETLLAESAEMAWIATEGNAFNHATDRVADVEALAAREKALGRPMKELVEVAREGRVRQTAFRAATVGRRFAAAGGGYTRRDVPGSFYEFITRLPDGAALDLNFDSSNAQGIFRMTAGSR